MSRAVVGLLTLALGACGKPASAPPGDAPPPVVRIDPSVNGDRPVQPFTAIETDAPWKVRFVREKKPRLEVNGDDPVAPQVVIQFEGGRLKISRRADALSTPPAVLITAAAPELVELVSRGSGDVVATGFGGDTFRVELAGSGSARIDGRATVLTAVLTGSGALDTDRLDADHVDVAVRGSGAATVRASKAVKAELAGSGDVIITGTPATVDEHVTGSGKITRRP